MTTADDLRDDLFQDGQWHPDSFRAIYRQLEQDPRPFAVLHQQNLDSLGEYQKLLYLAYDYILSAKDERAAKLLDYLVYTDAQALWRSFTPAIRRDPSYNERHFEIIAIMRECIGIGRAAVTQTT